MIHWFYIKFSVKIRVTLSTKEVPNCVLQFNNDSTCILKNDSIKSNTFDSPLYITLVQIERCTDFLLNLTRNASVSRTCKWTSRRRCHSKLICFSDISIHRLVRTTTSNDWNTIRVHPVGSSAETSRFPPNSAVTKLGTSTKTTRFFLGKKSVSFLIERLHFN